MARVFLSSYRVIIFRLIAISFLLWVIIIAANRLVAPQHLPWKPLDLNAPLGLATKTQLMKISLRDRKACAGLMSDQARNTQFEILDAKDGPRRCGWSMALRSVESHNAQFSPPDMTALCPMSAASYIWIGEVDKSAQAFLGSGLKRVHHFGTYSCRNIAGTSQLSEHAFANAWDVSGFELYDGRVISVRADWNGEPMRAAFLREVKSKACKVFRVTLSPDYNAAHHDHFHLDMGPTRSCR